MDTPTADSFTFHSFTRSRFTGTWSCEDCGLLPVDPDDAETFCPTSQGSFRYLMRHGDLRVPCSRYGSSTSSCASVAYVVALIVSGETGEIITEGSLDHAMSLVVNDHDDPETLIREYGSLYEIDPDDYLDTETGDDDQ